MNQLILLSIAGAGLAVGIALQALRAACRPRITVINVHLPAAPAGRRYPSLPDFVTDPKNRYIGGFPHGN